MPLVALGRPRSYLRSPQVAIGYASVKRVSTHSTECFSVEDYLDLELSCEGKLHSNPTKEDPYETPIGIIALCLYSHKGTGYETRWGGERRYRI